MRLAAAGLAICEDANIVTVDSRLHHIRSVGEYFLLRRGLAKHGLL